MNDEENIDDLNLKGDSLEARQMLLMLSVKIQKQFWRQFRFKFQAGWICAGLLQDNDFALAITKARHIINEEGCDVAEDFFDQIWNHYLQGMADGDFRDWRKFKEGDEE